MYNGSNIREVLETTYRIAGKFGGGKVWQIDSFQAFIIIINCFSVLQNS